MDEKAIKAVLTGQREEFQRHVEGQMRIQQEEFQRYLGVLKEDSDSKFKLLAEQLGSINNKLASHSDMIGALVEDVQIIKSDVQFLKGALKKKVDYDEFEALVRRVSLLESKIRS